jgi:hypothetical protein
VGTKEGSIWEWTVTQAISKKEEGADDVKNEGEVKVILKEAGEERGKRQRAHTPDEEDLVRFKVQEKVYPVDTKDEGDVKAPIVGFKKRKIGAKGSRVRGLRGRCDFRSGRLPVNAGLSKRIRKLGKV